jgi:hypothetical protein
MTQKVTGTDTTVVVYKRPPGCTEYCGRYVHVHVQGESLAHDLYKMGEISAMGGLLLMKAATSPELEAPLVSRVVIGGTGFFTTFVAPAACIFTAGLAHAAEKVYGLLKKGTMELTAEDVQELRVRLNEQTQTFGESDEAVQRLDLLRKEVLPILAGEIAAAQEAVQKGQPIVGRLSELYRKNQDVFAQALMALDLVAKTFATSRTEVEQQNIVLLADWTRAIELQREKSGSLQARVVQLRAKIEEKKRKLEDLQRKAQALSVVEGMQYTGIEDDTHAYVTQATLQQKGVSHGDVAKPAVVVY